MAPSGSHRRAWVLLGAAMLLALGDGCARRRSRLSEEGRLSGPLATPRPSPTRRPRPRPPTPTHARAAVTTPAPTPTSTPAMPLVTPIDVGDVTRGPYTSLIDARTTGSVSEALRAAERARLELERGTTDRAIEEADGALRLSPSTTPAWVVRARALLAEGSPTEARADLERARALSPPPVWMAEIVALLGACDEAEGRNDAALAAYRRALVLFPANQSARDGMRRLSSP